MIDFEEPRLVRFNSFSEPRSPMRVTTSRRFRAPALFLICCSIHSRVLFAKITTVGLRRWFRPASSSSFKIGKMRFDQPKMRVWLRAMIGERPFLISMSALLIIPTMKPVTVPPEATASNQYRMPTIRSAQLGSPALPRTEANEPQKVSKVIGASGAVPAGSRNGRRNSAYLMTTISEEMIAMAMSMYRAKTPLLPNELSIE